MFLSISFSQKGLLPITNYSRVDYHASDQNWDITQDNNGLIYIANNECILVYNGYSWKNIYVKNASSIRSIKKGLDGKIYVGAQNELGYIKKDNTGQLTFISLRHLLPTNIKFKSILQILIGDNGVYFRERNHFLFFDGTKFTLIKGKFSRAGIFKGKPIYVSKNGNVNHLKNNKFTSIGHIKSSGAFLYRINKRKQLELYTSLKGAFRYKDGLFSPFKS